MVRRSEFANYVVDQLMFVRGLRVRAMFGGYGVYQNDHMFAIIVNDMLYLKSDAIVQREFEEKGLALFTYVARGKSVSLRYYEAPSEVFDESESMRIWVEKALGASIRQGSNSANKHRRRSQEKPSTDDR